MAIFLKYNFAKKILIIVLVATFVVPLATLPKETFAVTNLARVAAAEAMVAAAETTLAEAVGGAAYTAGVLEAAVIAAETGELVADIVSVPTNNPVQDILTNLEYQHKLAKDIVEAERIALEVARTELALAQGEKESFWDAVAMGIVKIFLNRLTLNIVEWIRTGYDGRPTFLTEPEAFFQDVGNQATGVFINEMGLNEVLCEPWKFGAMFGLVFQKPYLIKAKCTLLDAEVNFQNMSQNFMAAGWQGFLDITVKQENNPYGAFLQAKEEVAVRIGKEEIKQKEDLARGRGFFSIKTGGECIDFDVDLGECVKHAPEKTVTPGSYIADSVSFLGMSSVRQAELADELNESLSVIAGEMIMQAINPNRGLASFDTVDLDAAAAAFAAQTSNRLGETSGNKLVDVTAVKTTKESSLALIQTIYPIYTNLIGRTDAFTDSTNTTLVTLNDITAGCLAQDHTTALASGDVPAVGAIEAKINGFIATLGEINNKEDGLNAELPALATVITSLTGWQSELSATPPPQPTRMTELTNLINSVVFPAPSAATQEYNDLDSKRQSAQAALTACGSS